MNSETNQNIHDCYVRAWFPLSVAIFITLLTLGGVLQSSNDKDAIITRQQVEIDSLKKKREINDFTPLRGIDTSEGLKVSEIEQD